MQKHEKMLRREAFHNGQYGHLAYSYAPGSFSSITKTLIQFALKDGYAERVTILLGSYYGYYEADMLLRRWLTPASAEVPSILSLMEGMTPEIAENLLESMLPDLYNIFMHQGEVTIIPTSGRSGKVDGFAWEIPASMKCVVIYPQK